MSLGVMSRGLSLGHVSPAGCFAGGCVTNYGVTDMPGWFLWSLIAVALAVGEIFTPGMFFLGPVALAALAAALTSALGAGAGVALLVFIAGSIASLALLRPIARRHVRAGREQGGRSPPGRRRRRTRPDRRRRMVGARVPRGPDPRGGRARRRGQDRGRNRPRRRIGGLLWLL